MLRERENQMFDKWRTCFPIEMQSTFIPDGIVDESGWNCSKIKILYLLKEVNGGTDWDEREYLANYTCVGAYNSQTINTLIRWQYGIAHSVADETWDEIYRKTDNKNIQRDMLSEIGLVNLKKIAGGGIVDWKNFDYYFASETNRTFLKEQLGLYAPDIVICGGTAYYLNLLYEIDNNDWLETSRGVRYLRRDNTVYIDFCHPNNRGPKNMIYYGLVDALQEICKF